MNIYVYLWYLAEFFLEWDMFPNKNCRQDQNTQFGSIFFPENRAVSWDNAEKYGRAELATDGNIMLHRKDAICTPDILRQEYRHQQNIQHSLLFPLRQRLSERAFKFVQRTLLVLFIQNNM